MPTIMLAAIFVSNGNERSHLLKAITWSCHICVLSDLSHTVFDHHDRVCGGFSNIGACTYIRTLGTGSIISTCTLMRANTVQLFTNRKSYVDFLIEPSTLTFSDLQRSNSRSYIFWVAISHKILQIGIYLLLFTNRK